MRRAAAELGHHARRTGQHRGERRAPDLGDDDAAQRHAPEVSLVQDDARRTGGPADPRRLTSQRRMAAPPVFRRAARLDT